MRARERLCVELGALRSEWIAFCTGQGLTAGEGARKLIVMALDAAERDGMCSTKVTLPWTSPGDTRARIELRLTSTELKLVDERAYQIGVSPNRWIVAMIRSQLLREPQLGMSEMRLLSDSNLQLATVNRWLSQLARDRMAEQFGQTKTDEIGVIRERIDAHLRTVSAVLRANLDRWSR